MEQNVSIILKKEDFIEQGDNLYMSLYELSRRLGYKSSKPLYNSYKNNIKEISEYTTTLKIRGVDGKIRHSLCFNEFGCYTLAMFSKSERAVAFRKAITKLLVELRKGNVGLVSAEEMSRMKHKMDLLRDDFLIYKKKYWKMRKAECIRNSRYLNQSFEKVIDNLYIRGLSFSDIQSITEIPNEELKYYLELAECYHLSEFEAQSAEYTTMHQTLYLASEKIKKEMKVTI